MNNLNDREVEEMGVYWGLWSVTILGIWSNRMKGFGVLMRRMALR